MAAVPRDVYHAEWERRRLRNIVHLTVGGCLGPCALANVALLLLDGHVYWFHSVNSEAIVRALYDYAEALLDAGHPLPPPAPLDALHFTASTWQRRPDGTPLDDGDRWARRRADAPHLSRFASLTAPPSLAETGEPRMTEDASPAAGDPLPALSDALSGLGTPFPARERGAVSDANRVGSDPPRKNGELVFDEPWQSRAFGMAVALSEDQCYAWDDFRSHLIARIAEADARDDPAGYYERWLAALEYLLEERGIVVAAELDERTAEFEFGERDDVF